MKLVHGADRRAEAHALRGRGQRLGVDLAQLVEAGGRERVAGDVLDVRGEIANGALRVDEAWLLGAGRAKPNELHGESLLGACGRLAVHGRRRAYPVALVPLQVKGHEVQRASPRGLQRRTCGGLQRRRQI